MNQPRIAEACHRV